jgi:hypothetical protein
MIKPASVNAPTQSKRTITLSHNHLQAADNLKFKEEPKIFNLAKENVDTTTTTTASSI